MIDGHMHLEYGPLTQEYVLQFVNKAIEEGLDEIQILDHTHRFVEFKDMYDALKAYPQQKAWLESGSSKFSDKVSDFVSLMSSIKSMNLPIKILYGLEVCYTPQNEQFIREVLNNYEFDFLVGAIHSVDGILYDMSFSRELLWDKYSADHIYQRYYCLLEEAVSSGLFTQLAHPDTIKLFQIYPEYDLTDTYVELANSLNKYQMKAECNTGCHYRYGHPDIGLSDELLRIFIENDVEIITASDAHHPEDVGKYIKEAQERIDKMRLEINNI